jgi:pheromone a factor receptor
MTDVIIGLPLAIFMLKEQAAAAKPWMGWAYVHADWMRVDSYSDAQVLTSASGATFHYLSRWFKPLLSLIAFTYFGTGEDAVAQYIRWCRWVKARFAFRKGGHKAVKKPVAR